MLLSIITVAFRNLEGIVKTHASLAHLAQAEDISFEWIVVDGGSNDGTREYLENLNGIYNLRFVSEPDNGIYDANYIFLLRYRCFLPVRYLAQNMRF